MSRQTTYYGDNGVEVKEDEKAYAKATYNDETNREIFYILCNKKAMINPFVQSINRNAKWEFLKVSATKFNYFMQFLKTRSEKYYTLAKREF